MPYKSLTVVTSAAILSSPVWAHHSHGNYQMTDYKVLKGTVTEFLWLNPHVWIYLEVAEADGQSAIWILEGADIRTLTRAGITRETVKVGDAISARCHPLRDGSAGCLLGFVTPQGGVEKEWD